MPQRIARAAVNDQRAWYLGDHVLLPGQSDRTPVYFHRRDASQPARPGSLATSIAWRLRAVGMARIRAQIMPRDKPHTEFESGAQIIHHLLRHRKIQASMHRATAERGAVVLPAYPQAGLLPLESRRSRRSSLPGGRLQIMRRRKTVLTNRAGPASQCDPRPQLRYPWLTPSVGAGVKAAA